MKDKRGPNDLEVVIKKLQLQNKFLSEQLEFAGEKIQMLEKQKKYMQDQLRKAGAKIKEISSKAPRWDDTE